MIHRREIKYFESMSINITFNENCLEKIFYIESILYWKLWKLIINLFDC